MAKDKSAIVSGAGWIGGFVDQLVREMLAQGWTHDAIHALVQTRPEDQPIKAIVAGMRKGFPPSAIAAKYGYEVVEDVQPAQFQVKDLEFVRFLTAGEQLVNGDVMRSRAVTLKANLGLTDGQYILDHQDEIPVEMRGKYIILTGTKVRSPDGRLLVAYLYWDGGRWYLGFRWIGDVWYDSDRLPRRKSA